MKRYLLMSALLLCGTARAATINITPSDDWTKIEAAQAGDEVVIAPGTYAFRVYLTQTAPANNPIIIRAQDPNNKPVVDFGATLTDDAPGSYTAGDKGRGCWQISGGTNYQISGIVFQNCRNSTNNAAGIRYYNGATGIYLKDCVFKNNDNGLTGGTQDSELTVEYSEFDSNGNPAASAPTHNLYIYGGTFTMRYSYIHDSVQGQNFHVRAKNATIEYNWFARGNSYEGDLMTDDDATNPGAFSQSILLRGNVFVQKANPQNNSQVFVLFNDSQPAGVQLTLNATLVNNTFVGNGGHASFVHLAQNGASDATVEHADLYNNIVSGTSTPLTIDFGTIGGTNNYLDNGATVPGGSITGSIMGTAPFLNAGAMDYRPTGAAIGAATANAPVMLPDREYFQNETVTRQWRPRASVNDVGAFESTTTGPGIGPYDTQPVNDLGVGADDFGVHGVDDFGPRGDDIVGVDSGCKCEVGGRARVNPLSWIVMFAIVVILARRKMAR